MTADGVRIGTHEGAEFYTIGQRHLGIKFQIPNSKFSSEGGSSSGGQINSKNSKSKPNERKPFYVAEKDVKSNTITVAEGDSDPLLARHEIIITNVSFITAKPTGDGLKKGIEVYARIRYRQPLVKAKLIAADTKRITADDDGDQRSSAQKSADISLVFSRPVKFVAPGQSAVFYSKKGEMLGEGIIV